MESPVSAFLIYTAKRCDIESALAPKGPSSRSHLEMDGLIAYTHLFLPPRRNRDVSMFASSYSGASRRTS